MHDVIVVGGSYAGLSAALQLARGRRDVLVIDEGLRRNRFAARAHGFVGREGRDPSAIWADARTDVSAYPTVAFRGGRAESAEVTPEGFAVVDAEGERHEARLLILAGGVTDHLPEVPGLASRWGRSVFHCPYCHGYELDRGPVGVLAAGPFSLHQALLLPDWGGPVTLFLNGAFEPDAEARARLDARGVAVERERVRAVLDHGVVVADGRIVALSGLFVAPRTEVTGGLARALGCAFETMPTGEFIKTDGLKATSVTGVFACGDAARGAASVAFAVGDGAQAGASAHRSLVFS